MARALSTIVDGIVGSLLLKEHKMRCYCCNKLLNTQESTRRFKESGAFVDMCNECLGTIKDEVEVTEGNTQKDNDDGDLYDE